MSRASRTTQSRETATLIHERISGPDTLLKLYAAIDDGFKMVQRQLDTKQFPRDPRGGRPELSAAVGDFNCDGTLDLMTANIYDIVTILLNSCTPPTSQYSFTGFFQPVDTLRVLNQVTAGQSLPVTFSLGGNYGLNILAAGYPLPRVLRPRLQCTWLQQR